METLQATGLSFTYPGVADLAVRDISFKLKLPGFTALLGANGSGKSTLGRLISGLLMPDSGVLTLPFSPHISGWNRIGMVFQNPDEQLFNATVELEIAWGLENLALPRKEIQQRVQQTLSRFDLHSIAQFSPDSLSDGQKQLTALASVWAMNPELIILDEATAFLDPVWKKRLREFAVEFSRDRAVFWISTRAEEAQDADEIWLMENGKLARQGSVEILQDTELLETLGIVH